MKEARITCRTSSVRLHDLDIQMFRGDVEFIPAEKALASCDLRIAQGAKAVDVYYIHRSHETRPIAPSPPPSGIFYPKAVVIPAQVLSKPGVDEEKLVNLLFAKLRPFIGEQVTEGVKQQMQDTLDASLAGVREAITRPVGQPRGVDEVFDYDAKYPVAFIPQDLAGSVKGTVGVKEDESARGGDMEDATATLKATRRKKKKETK